MKSDSKNSFNTSNREIIKAKSKLFVNSTNTNNHNKDLNTNSNFQLYLHQSNTVNLEDYSLNLEQQIYKSNKLKRVLNKDQNNDLNLICCSTAEKGKSFINCEKGLKPKNSSDGGKELEEHEIILNRRGSEERVNNNRYSIVNSNTEKFAELKDNIINRNNNLNKDDKKSNKNKNGTSFNFKINLKDLQDNSKNSDIKPSAKANNFSLTNHPNYLKMKEYTIKKVNSNLYEDNPDSNQHRYSLKQSIESLNNPTYYQNKKKDLYNYNYINNSKNNNYIIQNSNKNKNNTNINKNSNNKIMDKNLQQMANFNFSSGRSANRLTDAREKRFSKRFSTEKNNICASNNSTEKNSDINKINQKLNDVCDNLALFKIKSDSLRNSTNIESNPIASHLRKESSDFEFNFRSNLINTDNTFNYNFGAKRKDEFNALRSSDPITYSKNNKLDAKFVKHVILSHRYFKFFLFIKNVFVFFRLV
jgi:hypothetical protein